jgi:transcriptional regulator with XRE-family HTH domain
MAVIGVAIEAARIQQALSQSALAARLGVQQQTVSRWEKDQSKPRGELAARLAAVLKLSVDDLGLGSGSPARRATLRPALSADAPVRPLLDVLPFDRLSAEQFEQFTADFLARRYPEGIVNRLGGQGDDQRGYDITVDFPDGRHIGVQCKRVAQFGPKKVATAVAEAELDVDRSVIALARSATSAATFEVRKHPGWELWDQGVLSRELRALPRESAIHLVRSYFGGYLESFLGIRAPSPWATADEFFADTPFTLLKHRQTLVGREATVAAIGAWAGDLKASQIGLLVGRGGLGKSKVLYELTTRTRSPALEFRFLGIGQIATPDSFEALPRHDHLVVVIDDAPGVDGIAGLAAQLWQHRPSAKLLLATRPHGVTVVETETWRLNQSARSIERWALEDLSSADAHSLVAALIARPINDPVTRQLAAISADCPLVAVVAADLLKRSQLNSDTFASSHTLRTDILQRFAEVSTARGSGADATERRAVLNAVAAYQPVRQRDTGFADAFTALTGIPSWDVVVGRLTELEDTGLLMRRGDALRVVPDLLGDILLGQAAFNDRSRLPTGYLRRAQAAATSAPLQHLLINASRMQWQVREAGAAEVELVGDLWSILRDELLATSHEQQVALLEVVERIAFYQPAPALSLVRDLLASESSAAVPPDEKSVWPSATRDDVVHAVAPILRNIGYNLAYLRESLDILWDLAQTDNRPTNQHPDHPLRILADLADLRSGKPLTYLDTVIDAATNWLQSPVTDGPSPFEVIEPILATEGMDPVSTDSSITFHAFGIRPDTVRDLRSRVIDLALREARTDDIVRAVRGVNALETAIHEPIGMFNRQPSDAEHEAWAAAFLPVIEALGDLGAEPDHDPAIRLVIREALGWHAANSNTDTKAAAQAALAKLHTSLQDELAMCLHDGWGRLSTRDGLDFEAAEQQRITDFTRVGNAITQARTEDEVLDQLEYRLRVERTALKGSSGSGRFLFDLFEAHLPLAVRLCERALANELPELTRFAPSALAALADVGDPRAIDFASAMIAGRPELRVPAAQALTWNRGLRTHLLDGEFDLLVQVATDDDEVLRELAGRAVYLLGLADKARALELLSQIVFRGSKRTAAEALFAFVRQGSLDWTDTTQDLRERIVAQLVECSSIDDYQILSALSELSLVEPLAVTNLLITRVDRQNAGQEPGYAALPYQWDPPLKVQETADLPHCLARIRDWMTNAAREAWNPLSDDPARVFELIAGGWTEQVLTVLKTFDRTRREAALITAARILSRTPIDVFFDNAALITEILRAADALGDDALRQVRIALTSRGMQVWTFRGNEPPAHEVRTRDRATELATALPRGTIEERFFRDLAADAEAHINWAGEREEDSSDGRHW